VLSTQSYLLAMGLYLGVALIALGLFYKRVWISAPIVFRRGFIGLIAPLLLLPAHPRGDVDTLAPALVVASFNGVLGGGWPEAQQAVAILIAGAVVGLVLGVISGLIAGRARTRR
jgi:hypothetical protein